MAAALAASQVGTTLANPAQTEPDANSGSKNRATHDTPPPILFENGSFVLERKGQFPDDEIGINTANNRKEYRIKPDSGSTVVPAHIKILDGSGEMLYRNDKAADCLITIELGRDSGPRSVVNARTSANKSRFVIDVDANKSLDVGNANNNDKPTSRRRNRRYRHSGGADMSMKEIAIKEGNKTLYSLSPDVLPKKGEDLRIMIWLEPA